MSRLLLAALFLFLGTTAAFANDNSGFIYGTLTLQDGETHTGFLRWDSEEAFWDVIRFFTF